jgi:hypothetical protein
VRLALRRLVSWWIRRRGVTLRPPDFVIGDPKDPYLLRWWLIPRNRWFNVYLHCFLRSDDDRALHDHPWCWASLMLEGAYTEHTIAAGGVHRRATYTAGSLRLHWPRFAHRLEVRPEYGECWTLFVTGPRVREWCFHCARGLVLWTQFTKPGKPGEVGRGCD